MQWRWSQTEPTLDDLLRDDAMLQAVRSAGLEPAEFRRRMAEMAARLAAGQSVAPRCCAPV
jgi:hypothetical protein